MKSFHYSRLLMVPLALAAIVLASAPGHAQSPVGNRAQPQTISIWASRIIDGDGHLLTDARVVIKGSRIVAVDHEHDATYDLAGMTLMPGFINTWDHITEHFNQRGVIHHSGDGEDPLQVELSAEGEAWKTLMGGFTTVASAGASPATVKALRDWINMGRIPGPRILAAFHVLTPYSLPEAEIKRLTPAELRDQVQERASDGANYIEIYATGNSRNGGAQTVSEAQLQAMCGEARKLGLPSLVQAYADSGVRAAVLAGCTEVQLGFYVKDSTLRLMAKTGTVFMPVCGLGFHNYLENAARYEGEVNKPFLVKMIKDAPVLFRRALAISGLKIAYGIDGVAGAHGRDAEDMVCRVDVAGANPMQVITEATSASAKALGLGKEIGTIAPGMQADLVAVAGNPLKNIKAVMQVHFVMRDGRVFKNVALGDEMGAKVFQHDGPMPSIRH